VTFDDVISGEKAQLGRILHNFRLLMRTPFQGNTPSVDVSSGHTCAMVRSTGSSRASSRNTVLSVPIYYYYTHTNTNNVNKTWILLQTTGGTRRAK
jgi:hypothetical protein